MYWFGFLFVLLFVVQGFFSLDEEMLIILAGIFWLDAAGALIRNIIEKELVYKAVLIKDNFLWFLQKQRENIQELKTLHLIRSHVLVDFIKLKDYFTIFLIYLLQKRIISNIYKLRVKNAVIFYQLCLASGRAEKSSFLANSFLFFLRNQIFLCYYMKLRLLDLKLKLRLTI